MNPLYTYVGPKAIAERAVRAPAGTVILNAVSILQWMGETGQETNAAGEFIATFVIDCDGRLRIADRQSEHVACAGGDCVMSAGEITFHVHGNNVRVVEVSNQSTGYCPEPKSWQSVRDALQSADMNPPHGFEPEISFRRCVKCGATNIVKDGIFECDVCSEPLPSHWNFFPLK